MFDWVEYAVFSVMLLLSILIGVYFGWFKKQDTVAEYMLGGKKMGVFPVTLSLIFSHVSGVTFLGVPAEIYSYGSQYHSTLACVLVMYPLVTFFYLPVFYELQLNSLYEYMELRFSKNTRTATSLIFAISLVTFIPVVIYIPALAFNQVTGISVHVITPIVSLICIFYTLFGGLKAVVWTDALQSVFTIGSTLFVLVLGLIRIGSISEVFRINQEGTRVELFNMNPNPFVRNSFWTFSLGHGVIWAANIAVHPGAVQRFIAVATFKQAKAVMLWSVVGFFFIVSLVTCVGWLLYATYYDCDPVATKMINKPGQILPFFVMEVARDYPGLTGLFISGVLSAALSTMSASLNTVAGTIYEDFVRLGLKGRTLRESQQNLVIKTIVLVLGLFCIIMVYVVERLGTIFQVALSLIGLTNGTLFGVFSLGIFIPRANSKGVIWGSVCSMLGTASVMVGAQYYRSKDMLRFPGKVTSVDGCSSDFISSLKFNASALVQTYRGFGSPIEAESVPLVFQLSYMYYGALGALLVFLVGVPVSYLTEEPLPRCMDPRLFTPAVRRFLPDAHKPKEYTLVNTKAGTQDDNMAEKENKTITTNGDINT